MGMACQYSGPLRKTDNCHYMERTIASPVAIRLYLPQEARAEVRSWKAETVLAAAPRQRW